MSIRILTGDCREVLKSLPDESVHCVVTSPPYFGLRDYGVAGQVGLEASHLDYVSAMADLFDEVRRVLRSDGICWLNLGDSYAGYHGNKNSDVPTSATNGWVSGTNENARTSTANKNGLKPKDLIGIPWRVAFALQDRGWWLRGDHVWGKPNGMPESIDDRPTRGHEYVFMLTKSARYWYDSASVRTAPKASTITRLAQDVAAQDGSERANGGAKTNGPMKAVGRRPTVSADRKELRSATESRHRSSIPGGQSLEAEPDGTASLRSIWWVPPAQFSEAHFAVMPDRVAEICIRAGCPTGGVVLDPFGGAGTVGLVADRLQRDAILIELNPDYAAMAERRITGDAPMFAKVSR